MSFTDELCFVIGFIIFSIAIGVLGFRLFTGYDWYNSICLASLTLGNNYVPTLETQGLLFIALYSLYGTIIFYVIATVVVDSVFRTTHFENQPVAPLQPRNPARFNDQ